MDIFRFFIFNHYLNVVRIGKSVEMMHGVLPVTAVMLCTAFIAFLVISPIVLTKRLSVCQWWSSVSVTGYRRMRWCWSGWPSAPTRTDSNSTWTTWTSLSMRLQYTFFQCVCKMKYDACSSGHFFCSFFVQVLNKRKKSKQNARKEAFNRTRDIHTIEDLYPPQQIL